VGVSEAEPLIRSARPAAPAAVGSPDPRSLTVDVLIAVYNAAPFLREMFDSVRAQTVKPTRILVLDDGSTDGSAEILAHEPGIELMHHPGRENLGQSATLRALLAASTSSYVAIIDADDLWYPTKLETHLTHMAKDPGIALTYCDGWVVDAAGQRLWPLLPERHVEPNDVNALLMNCYIRTPTSVVVRRDVMVAADGLRPGLIPCDHDLWLRIAEKHPLVHLPDKLCDYRTHPAQVSGGNRRMWEHTQRVLVDAWRRHPYRLSSVRKRWAVISYRLGKIDLGKGNRVRGLALLARAALLDPPRALRTFVAGD